MNKVIHLEPNKVPVTLRGSYTGKMFKAEVCESMTIPSDAGLWFEGTRHTFKYIRLEDGKELDAVNHNASPWNKSRQDVKVDLKPGYAVVEHTIFCGKDMGLRFYVHHADVVSFLPAPVELSDNSRKVLGVISAYKSTYRGDEYRRMGLSPESVGLAKEELFSKGLINTKGAITVAGRNALA